MICSVEAEDMLKPINSDVLTFNKFIAHQERNPCSVTFETDFQNGYYIGNKNKIMLNILP